MLSHKYAHKPPIVNNQLTFCNEENTEYNRLKSHPGVGVQVA